MPSLTPEEMPSYTISAYLLIEGYDEPTSFLLLDSKFWSRFRGTDSSNKLIFYIDAPSLSTFEPSNTIFRLSFLSKLIFRNISSFKSKTLRKFKYKQI